MRVWAVATFCLGWVQFRCKACVLWNTVIVLVTSAHEQKSGKQGDYYSDQTMTSSHKNRANSQETTRRKGRKEGRKARGKGQTAGEAAASGGIPQTCWIYLCKFDIRLISILWHTHKLQGFTFPNSKTFKGSLAPNILFSLRKWITSNILWFMN